MRLGRSPRREPDPPPSRQGVSRWHALGSPRTDVRRGGGRLAGKQQRRAKSGALGGSRTVIGGFSLHKPSCALFSLLDVQHMLRKEPRSRVSGGTGHKVNTPTPHTRGKRLNVASLQKPPSQALPVSTPKGHPSPASPSQASFCHTVNFTYVKHPCWLAAFRGHVWLQSLSSMLLRVSLSQGCGEQCSLGVVFHCSNDPHRIPPFWS